MLWKSWKRDKVIEMQKGCKLDMQTEEKKRTGVCREAFSDFRKKVRHLGFCSCGARPDQVRVFLQFYGDIKSFHSGFGALSCLLVFLFFCAFRRKGIPAVLYLLASLLMFANVLYHGYYNSYLTVRIINSAKMVGDITASISELTNRSILCSF